MEEEFERKLTLSESNEGRISVTTPTKSASNEEEVPIEFSPFYKHFTEEEIMENMIHVHEHYFQWKCVGGQNKIAEEFFKKNKSVTFVRSGKQTPFQWTNKIPFNLTKLSSVHRILVIRDITQRLRLLDEEKDDKHNKMLTESGETTVHFKLDDITFSLKLNPTDKQPGNALLEMQGTTGTSYASPHFVVENNFDCFKNLDPKDIESIVKNARKTGEKITDSDIKNSKQDKDRKKMAEEMNFFMLLYDFEVARRLQRPFRNGSHHLDSLPIGIGIAMIHCINGTENQENEGKKEKKWMFFSGLLQKDCESRKLVLQEIFVAFKKCNKQRKSWTEGDWISILCEQFDQ